MKEMVFRIEVEGNRVLVDASNPRLSWKLPDPTYLLRQIRWSFDELSVFAFTSLYKTWIRPHIDYKIDRET